MIVLYVDELVYQTNGRVRIDWVDVPESGITPGVEVRIGIDLVACVC
jgi:hypothetical protein